MSLYSAMFAQYGIATAQVLVTTADFGNELTRVNLQNTLNELLALNVVPILNTNDAVVALPDPTVEKTQLIDEIQIKDNDSLAARLAVLLESDLLLIMSDVDGVCNKPPNESDSRLMHTFNPLVDMARVNFGGDAGSDIKSKVGTGGMSAKVEAAAWALRHNCSVVICNGQHTDAIVGVVGGKKIGTHFTNGEAGTNGLTTAMTRSVEEQAIKGNDLSNIV